MKKLTFSCLVLSSAFLTAACGDAKFSGKGAEKKNLAAEVIATPFVEKGGCLNGIGCGEVIAPLPPVVAPYIPAAIGCDSPLQNFPVQGEYLGKDLGFPGQNAGIIGKELGFPGQNAGIIGKELGFPGQNAGIIGKELGYPGQNGGYLGAEVIGFPGQNGGLYYNYVGGKALEVAVGGCNPVGGGVYVEKEVFVEGNVGLGY